jgi:YesN/AraC family two-component response regulator
MNLLSMLEQPDVTRFLDLLLTNPLSKEKAAERLGISYNRINEITESLENCGAIKLSENRYSICFQNFRHIAGKLMKYSVPINEIESNDDSSNYEQLFEPKEPFEHAPFDREMEVYESICSGNLEMVKLLAKPLCSKGFGILSPNPIRNIKYHMIVSVAMITRFCINGGMPQEEAYTLSDFYIIKTDECATENEVHELHAQMLADFTKKMHNVKVRNIYSKQIVKAVDYINSHVHERIMIQEISDCLSLSVPYLSRLFKSEVGLNISEYITIKKVEAASGMLKYSEHTLLEISCSLSFSSQSYFIKVFKKYTGMTPKEYQKRYGLFSDSVLKTKDSNEYAQTQELF